MIISWAVTDYKEKFKKIISQNQKFSLSKFVLSDKISYFKCNLIPYFSSARPYHKEIISLQYNALQCTLPYIQSKLVRNISLTEDESKRQTISNTIYCLPKSQSPYQCQCKFESN